MRLIVLLAALSVTIAGNAQDATLAALKQSLSALRDTHPSQSTPWRYPARELTAAKHHLRDWIESQIQFATYVGEAIALSPHLEQMLTKISAAKPSELGSAGVTMKQDGGHLIVITSLGITDCSSDQSVYAYLRTDDRWQRIWQSEQDPAVRSNYGARHIVSVQSWQPPKPISPDTPTYFLTLATGSGCSSNWHPVYYSVSRTGPSGSKLLIDQSDFAYFRGDPPIQGSIGPASSFNGDARPAVLIEFTQQSIDGGVHNRESVHRFIINGDNVARTDPVALSPPDFVDEWLTNPFETMSAWTESPSLRQVHDKLHNLYGEFSLPTTRCAAPDTWQVTFTPQGEAKTLPPLSFLVRWRPPYRFSMVAVRDTPSKDCAVEDVEADAWRTLFNGPAWRW